MREHEGREVWNRLLNWDKGQASSERLAAQILIYEKYESVDPSHPLGGRDGLKDIICVKNSLKFIGSVYFARGQKRFTEIEKKYCKDIKGIEKNSADGILFVTNQELRLSERDRLIKLLPDKKVDIFHLERISSILNTPVNYGIRLEFLGIEMNKEEQLAYMAAKDILILDLKNYLIQIMNQTKELHDHSNEPTTNVTPEYLTEKAPFFPLDSGIISIQKVSFHKCSFCGYGYKIIENKMNPLFSPSSYYGSINIGPIGIGLSSKKIITCPKCGNTEEYFGY